MRFMGVVSIGITVLYILRVSCDNLGLLEKGWKR